MASFAEFISTFDGDINRRGKQFERFVKWFLKNDPEWATQVKDVWLWEEYPGRWGPDCGIDLVFKSKTGRTWAVQAKCYSSDYDISKNDVDTFLSESNRRQIDHRLFIATTDRIGANARQVLDAQEKSVVRYLLSHFESAAVEFPDSVKSLSSGKRKPPPELDRPHQIEAVDAVLYGFQTSRGQLIMACGTGKTFVCLWVKERLKAKRTLVLVPSLGLLSQILNEWTFAAREPFDALCVCSDQTVSRRDEDEAIGVAADLPFPVSNNVEEIAEFLKSDGDQVIFSTYQSSLLIAQAQNEADAPRFDLVIADEAHRCAGKNDSIFGTVLSDQLIKTDRRLFATATPRVYRTSLKKAAEVFSVEVVDMNDEESFGKRFHTLTFGEAIKREQLTDYRVLVVGVDNERVKDWIENRRLVATDTGFATDARSLAGQIGLLKAIRDWKLHRLISFHGRVKGARVFSEDIVKVAEWLDDDHRPSGNLWADHVSGEMPTIARRQKLKRLKNVGNGDIGLLSNARCLSEGVDVPALDGVAFIDPRSSEIDIIQSVGRAIRLSENKTMGTIVIPVFIEQTDNAEEALQASNFKPIWDVLEALKSHDDRLSDELDQLRIELGAKRKRSISTGDLTKIVFDLPTSVNENFARSLRAHLVEQTTESWMFWYGLLESFVKEHGHCRVPRGFESIGSFRLDFWTQNLRQRQERISADRRERLDVLAFDWDPFATDWEEGFEHLQAFKKEHGHCRVSQAYKSPDGYRLGQWVAVRRRHQDTISLEKRKRIDALGFDWDPLAVDWEEGFEHLQAFKKEHGHCRVPAKYKSPDGYRLGQWVDIIRAKPDKVLLEKTERLDAAGFDWNPIETRWEEGFERLQAFKDQYGHCRVSQAYKSPDGFLLNRWVEFQRKQKDGLSRDKKERLDALGFDWDPFATDWQEGFEHLQAFKKEHGHCRVPAKYKSPDGYRLGGWVRVNRTRQERISADRRERLDALNFDWNPFAADWEEGFGNLKKFLEIKGHCRVPFSYRTHDDYQLGVWVGNQRTGKDKMDFDRRQRLEALPGWSWDVLSDQWDEGFSYLKQFSDREGHCRVPQGYKTNGGYRLGGWVTAQRGTKEKMEPARRQRLEALPGWSWDPHSDLWEEGFSHLKQFSDHKGHCRVPQTYKTDSGYPLGAWVGQQRQTKDKMDPDRRQRLEALPGWVWKVEK
jgi:superfamily II DNA or RNA helicase